MLSPVKNPIRIISFLCLYVIATTTLAQSLSVSTCPTIERRNNGNGQANGAAGIFTGYSQNNPVATNVVGTSYQNVAQNPANKTGNINFYWTSATPVTNLPVLVRAWIAATGSSTATMSSIVFGPPPPPVVIGQNYYVNYCFYGQNIPPSGKIILEFVNPQTNQPAFTCTYDL